MVTSMIFDTHAHYEDEKFDPDRAGLLAALPDKLIETVVNVGSTMDTSRKSVALAEEYPYIYAAVGIHPEEDEDFSEENIEELRELAQHDKTVAIGEIGLDYYWVKDPEKRDEQKYWFKRQLELARELDLPVIIHSRDAAGDTYDILKEAAEKGTRAVIHCYSYSPEQAVEYVKMGYYIGVGGVVTFKNGRKLKETVKSIPLDRILTETDCPYMAPERFRGMRNDSTYIVYMIKEMSKILEITEDEVMETTRRNGHDFYRI